MHWFTNLKTRSKLFAGFGLLILLLIVVIIAAWTSIQTVRDAESSNADVMKLCSNYNGQRAAMLTAMMLPPGAELEAKLQEVETSSNDNIAIYKLLDTKYRNDAELQPLLEQIATVRAEFVRARDAEVVPLIRQQQKDEAAALISGAQSERFEKFRSLARDLYGRLAARSQATLAQSQLFFLIVGAAAVLAGIVMSLLLNRAVAAPISQMAGLAARIAAGDLTVSLPSGARTDEIGVLTQTFRQMTDNLRGLMQDILEAVNVLASSATEIVASTTQLAASAAETASAITETTATVEEVKQTSQLSSQKARTVAEESERAAEVAKGGKRAVEQTIEGMNGIRNQMGAVAESILSLSAQSQAIGEIIAAVDDLAAQSKLLAVNAAIEAAKAGEEGKGFSVVAQEVKSLAEQSKQATTQVRGILGDIQKATSSAVLATEQGSKAVENGVRQSGQAGESIGTLSDSIAAAAQAASQIAATSQQQFVGMDQVALAMENIKTASTQTVASTRQAETAAQQLHDLGQKLKQLVARFKV